MEQPASSVSVVVPSHNHARFVGKCLLSIMGQTAAPCELIVIDDGSSDGSAEVIARLLKNCSFPAELIARPNKGLSATLNEGLQQSRGDYFAYLGSDDLWFPEFLAARVASLESRPDAVLAYGHAFSIDEEDRIIDSTNDWAAYTDGDVRQMLLSTLAPLSPTVVYRRSTLEQFGWNEQAKLEDYELYLHLSSIGSFAFDPRVLSAWRQHGANTSLNLNMMLVEKLAAQRLAAPEIGINSAQLERLQALAQFRSAQEFMRAGEKSLALKMLMQHWRASPAGREVARTVVGILTPHSLVRWNRKRRQEKANKRYGPLPLLNGVPAKDSKDPFSSAG